ncbi:MAG: hypothetical protein R3B48_23725 [Kofleriaceae bacterium]
MNPTIERPSDLEFPLGDTLGGGAWRVTEHLRGGGSQQLFLGESTRPGDAERGFVSMIWAPKGVPEAELRRTLGYRHAGVHELAYLGTFDPRGDAERREAQRQYCALVERVPEGEWLPRLLPGPLGVIGAIALGRSLGALLQGAAKAGTLLVGARPEYVWARRTGATLTAVSVSGRNWDFFAHTGGRCLVLGRLHERHYYAPEVYQELGEREASLCFTLATMIAEWATGAFPFPESWAAGDMSSQCAGRHAPLDLPAPLATLLSSCLAADPAQRPSLDELLERLASPK